MVLLNDPPRTRPGAPDWASERKDWPFSKLSKFKQIGRETWHIQRMATGSDKKPKALLLHGTGASTHSWEGIFPTLAEHYDTLAIDLPGHGFTQMRAGFVPTLPNVTAAISMLLEALDFRPNLIIGHSAGAAIALSLGHGASEVPKRIVSLNGALQPFAGAMGVIAPITAKLVTIGGFAARALANSASDIGRVERLLYDTGSTPPADCIARYATLLRSRKHVQGTLEMMANWDLNPMEQICSELLMPILFLTGSEDRSVPPDTARHLAAITREGRYACLDGLGHLAHEEAPERVLEEILNEHGPSH
ncbi:MAG: alpha/beta fold hydrolase BchO [Pseudomonadota bacterium]